MKNVKTVNETRFKEVLERMKAEGVKIDYRDAETLRRLYWDEGLSTYEMAELLGVGKTTVLDWMKKHGISRKERIEALIETKEKYPKKPFLGDPEEKTYITWLRAGDFYACRHGCNIQFGTATTNNAMRKLAQNVIGRYGHHGETPEYDKSTKQYGFKVYCLLDGESFAYALEKPKKVPEGKLFWPALAAYDDSEGSWTITHDGKKLRFLYQLQTTNLDILKQFKKRLEEYGFHPNFYLIKKAGEVTSIGIRTRDLLGIMLERRGGVARLAEKLLPYSRHGERIAWMKLILGVKDEKYWADVKDRVLALREKIEKDTEACVKEAEKKYKTNHNGKDWFEVHSHSITKTEQIKKSAKSYPAECLDS